MVEYYIKRIYQVPSASDGYRVFVDRLWPRGIRKENLKYDLWEKELAPSTDLREWYHESPEERWLEFVNMYNQELMESSEISRFIDLVKDKTVVTLLYASKETEQNHALILCEFLNKKK